MVGNYELIGRVGSGSTSTVWKAHDPLLDRDVAVKRLDNPTAELREQWRAEARTLATLDEPHIVEVYGFAEDDDSAYIVEQWVEGATLAAVLAEAGRLSTAQALGVVRGALLGLAHAHQRGVVHRDVSAANILVDQAGTSRLIDFGLAAGSGGSAGSPSSRGASAYRSPEAHSGGPATPAGDVYSAAAVLAHLLTGVATTPPSVDSIDPAIRDVIRKALKPDPTSRYADAGAFLAALEEAAERRYGPAWWTEAGLAALVSATGIVTVTAAAQGQSAGGTSSATPIAAGVAGAATAPFVLSRPTAAVRFGGRMSRRAQGIAAAAAAVSIVAIGSVVATQSGKSDRTTGASQPGTSASAGPATAGSASADPGATAGSTSGASAGTSASNSATATATSIGPASAGAKSSPPAGLVLPIASVCGKADVAAVTALLGGPVSGTEFLNPGDTPPGRVARPPSTSYSCTWYAPPQSKESRAGGTYLKETVTGTVFASVAGRPIPPAVFAEGAAQPVDDNCSRLQVADFGPTAFGTDCVSKRKLLSSASASVTTLIGTTRFTCGAEIVGASAAALRPRVEQFCLELLQAASTKS